MKDVRVPENLQRAMAAEAEAARNARAKVDIEIFEMKKIFVKLQFFPEKVIAAEELWHPCAPLRLMIV